jgi:hypothetical protein
MEKNLKLDDNRFLILFTHVIIRHTKIYSNGKCSQKFGYVTDPFYDSGNYRGWPK